MACNKKIIPDIFFAALSQGSGVIFLIQKLFKVIRRPVNGVCKNPRILVGYL